MIKIPQNDEWPPRLSARKGYSLEHSCSCGEAFTGLDL